MILLCVRIIIQIYIEKYCNELPVLRNSVEVTVVTSTSVSGNVVTNSYVAYNIVALSLQ
jgi:hypothetical protein